MTTRIFCKGLLVIVSVAFASACGPGCSVGFGTDREGSAPATAVATAASLVLINGRIWTGDAQRPQVEAVAISGDGITAVGGAFVAPGFIDSPVHFLDGGFRLASVLLRDAKTPQEFAARIKAFADSVPAGTTIAPEMIRDARVVRTIAGGKTVFQQ